MRDRLQSRKCARYLKALADPDRLKIIQCLRGGPKTVTDLSNMLENDLANVSHHLGVLRHAGLVRDEKDGKFVVYSLRSEFFPSAAGSETGDTVDLGCCQLLLGTRQPRK